MLINDAIYHLDNSMKHLTLIKELEAAKDDAAAWAAQVYSTDRPPLTRLTRLGFILTSRRPRVCIYMPSAGSPSRSCGRESSSSCHGSVAAEQHG